MPEILQYLLKVSISVTAVYLFYRLLLSRLTFYQWNRWYLLGYTVLCFILPFWNIYGWMEPGSKVQLFRLVPAMHSWVSINREPLQVWTAYDLLVLALATGTLFMLVRLLLQYFSLRRMHRRARLLTEKGIRLYEVDYPIIPFSFGMSVFIHPAQHDEDELKEIIRHEMVHVKEHHTVDIIFAEILIALNWYNPFAWLLRQSIRQNLEFIADRQVLAHGLDRKQYQYLLLKVIGQQQFSMASHLNFSALKKRITMMNKVKSARVHLVKFLFALPILAVLLLAFRKEQEQAPEKELTVKPEQSIDTLPKAAPHRMVPVNSKGYYLSVADNEGECIVIIKDKSKKLVKAIALTDWNKDEKTYEGLYGKIPPPPPPPPPPASPLAPITVEGHPIAPLPPDAPSPAGELSIDAPPPPPPPPAPRMATNISSMEINNNKVVLQLKNGKTEKYDLADPKQKANFERKYGKLNLQPEVPEPDVLAEPVPEVKEVPAAAGEQITIKASSIMVHTDNTTEDKTSSDNPPAYFIDGKAVTYAAVKALNPNEISQVDVYKGKEAVAKFGEKGKNGVIQITRKKSG